LLLITPRTPQSPALSIRRHIGPSKRAMPQVTLPVEPPPERVEGRGRPRRPRLVSRSRNTRIPSKSRATLPAIHLARLPVEDEVAGPRLLKMLLLTPQQKLPRRSQARLCSLRGLSLLKSRATLPAIHLAKLPLEKKLPRRSQARLCSLPRRCLLKSRVTLPAIRLARLPLEGLLLPLQKLPPISVLTLSFSISPVTPVARTSISPLRSRSKMRKLRRSLFHSHGIPQSTSLLPTGQQGRAMMSQLLVMSRKLDSEKALNSSTH
jgi:hypothetical protein